MKKNYLLCLIFFTHCHLQAQNEVVSFSGIQIEKSILISFTLKSGVTCNGLVIEHAADTAGFTVAGDIPGICGSTTEEESYTFIDNSPPETGINYYRLNLGNLGYSSRISVSYFQYDKNGISIFPNPVTSSARVYFLNPAKEPYTILIFDDSGRQRKAIDIISDNLTLERKDYGPGIYFMKIFQTKNKVQKGVIKILFL